MTLISVIGANKTGKTMVAKELAASLQARGYDALYAGVGHQALSFINPDLPPRMLETEPMTRTLVKDPVSLAMLHAVALRETTVAKIYPHLKRRGVVIVDSFTECFMAYHSAFVPESYLLSLLRIACGKVKPSLNIQCKALYEVAKARCLVPSSFVSNERFMEIEKNYESQMRKSKSTLTDWFCVDTGTQDLANIVSSAASLIIYAFLEKRKGVFSFN